MPRKMTENPSPDPITMRDRIFVSTLAAFAAAEWAKLGPAMLDPGYATHGLDAIVRTAKAVADAAATEE